MVNAYYMCKQYIDRVLLDYMKKAITLGLVYEIGGHEGKLDIVHIHTNVY